MMVVALVPLFGDTFESSETTHHLDPVSSSLTNLFSEVIHKDFSVVHCVVSNISGNVNHHIDYYIFDRTGA
jgi:hypothetical protein